LTGKKEDLLVRLMQAEGIRYYSPDDLTTRQKQLEQDFLNCFGIAGIVIYQPKSNEQMNLWERVKRSRLNRNDYLGVLETWKMFVNSLKEHLLSIKTEKIATFWGQLTNMLCIAMAPHPRIVGFQSEAQWLVQGKELGRL